ncbi:hypothetical protein DRO97_01475 [Archaeoglobales archaeon]|nr:MAG: hypothetical protein DRO97_01475 [Archaeoglobales archaeon]
MRKLIIILAVLVAIGTGLIGYGLKGAEIAPEVALHMLGWTKKAEIAVDYAVTQGLDEPRMEEVKVTGTISNIGKREVRNLTITAIFIDSAHNRIIEKSVEYIATEARSLLPNERINFDANYFREATIPKTDVKVKIKVKWEEDEEHKAKIFPCVAPSKHSPKTNFFAKVKRYDYHYAIELIPEREGDYEVIYLFKENGSIVKCGDEVFYNVNSQIPIKFDFPVHRNSTVESYIEIYGLDGTILHKSIEKSTRPFREIPVREVTK